MTTSGAHQPFVVERCSLCGRPKYQKHAEVCAGRLQRIAPPPEPAPGSECDCNAGGMHEPDCVWVIP